MIEMAEDNGKNFLQQNFIEIMLEQSITAETLYFATDCNKIMIIKATCKLKPKQILFTPKMYKNVEAYLVMKSQSFHSYLINS